MRGQHIKSTQELLESARPRWRHPLVEFCEQHGYEVRSRKHDVVEMTNNEVRLRLHFFDKMFLSCYVIESDTRNLGKVKEEALKLYLAGKLCATPWEEGWYLTRWCKKEASHEGPCADAEGAFPVERAS